MGSQSMGIGRGEGGVTGNEGIGRGEGGVTGQVDYKLHAPLD